MQHKEDEQPNEAVHGRRKRILPFVRNTSRIPEQKKHQSSSLIAPSPGESSRGRGYGRGQDRGRGQGKHRGRGRGGGYLTRPPLELPRHIEGDSSSQRNEFWGNGPQYALPEPPTLSGSSFGTQPGPSSGHSSSEKPLFEKAENPAGKWTSYPKIPGSQQAARQHQNSERPRKRFRPRKNASHRHNNHHNRNDGDSLPAEASTEKQSLQKSTDFVQGDCGDPPAKRPRIKEEAASPSRDFVSLGNQETAVKSEIEDESPIRLLQEEPTSGSKFISYDSHPMCRFECGRPSNQVRKHRRTLKQQEVQALRDQGMNILAAFVRDDGIAIDWSLPMNKNGISGSKPTVTFNDLESNSFSPSGGPISLRLSAQNMPLTPNVNPPVITMDEPENGVSSTSTTKIAYREVPIPPQHLPQNGNTGKLETWSLEQMRLLESELGLVVLSPPEFVGIGEYLTGQRLPEGVCPYVKIRYKRSERARPHVEPGANPDGTCSFAELIEDPPVPSHGNLHSVPSSPIDPNEPKLPPIAHMQASHSSPLGSQVLEKDEVDELADHPPSPLVRPSPTHTSTDNSYAFGPNVEALGENELSELHAATDEEFLHIVPTAPSEELDELQRLRRDLELSRMEAERKHKELEGRILELSRKRPESHTPRPGQEQQPTTAIRIVDEEKSNIIPLRRGKLRLSPTARQTSRR
ncbi:unnamed protein product [Rhizoctonia solani]|uniref:Uncharacterized protein n=1 Tax=Rhizoctonia solani TaxID=456999 RepID=A0A8H3AJ43_9AGAM|nr:unnamed protein product [Rhizoctonia solani]